MMFTETEEIEPDLIGDVGSLKDITDRLCGCTIIIIRRLGVLPNE